MMLTEASRERHDRGRRYGQRSAYPLFCGRVSFTSHESGLISNKMDTLIFEFIVPLIVSWGWGWTAQLLETAQPIAPSELRKARA